MGLKIGDKISTEVESADNKGRGVMHAGGKTLRAYFVVPGDTLEGTVCARVKGDLRLQPDKIIKPSTHRVIPRCAYAGRCGGCPWQEIDYEFQCELKRNHLRETLSAVLDNKFLTQKSNFIPAQQIFFHRNRMDYVFGADGSLGLKEPERWAKVLNLSECFMLSDGAVKVMQLIRDHARQTNMEPWNNRRYTGFLRYLVIREGKNTGERLAMLTTSQGSIPQESTLAKNLQPLVTTFIHGINASITDLSLPQEWRTVYGNPFLTERIGEIIYRIPPTAFFQTNSRMAEVLRDTVVSFAAPTLKDTVLDLYCGVGFLTLALAPLSKQTIGVELDETAIAASQQNAKLNKVGNVTFSAGEAETLLSIVLSRDKPSIIVLDPPRSGLHPRALKTLMEYKAKRLIYVSCNVEALARDLTVLLTLYTPAKIRSIDLFPHTPHIETVIMLERST